MDTSFKTFVKTALAGLLLVLIPAISNAQEVQTLEMTTSQIQTIRIRLGMACLIQLPVEPLATQVGDSASWLVEKTDRFVSVKPINPAAKDTNLAIITRLGTLNFSLHFSTSVEPFDPTVRVSRILDDSKPLPMVQKEAGETLAEIMIREIRTSQNYYALKIAGSPVLKDVDQLTHLSEDRQQTHTITLLQVFRFRSSRHVILHFTLQNSGSQPVRFEPRKVIVSVKDTLFSPMAVSFGKVELPAGSTSENFVVLDGSTGLSPNNPFTLHLLP